MNPQNIQVTQNPRFQKNYLTYLKFNHKTNFYHFERNIKYNELHNTFEIEEKKQYRFEIILKFMKFFRNYTYHD